MKDLDNSAEIEEALRRLGELLEVRGQRYHIVVIGGSAVNLLGVRSRATTDVDILAFAGPDARGVLRLRPPDEPLPEPLSTAAQTVARDLGLDPHWLNTGPASQWRTGLPPGLESRVWWRDYGNLSVGIADRRDLVFFKLYAAADDRGPESVHFQDLAALTPTDQELEAAAAWVRGQDPSPDFSQRVSQVIQHARIQRQRPR
jgi:hypothetical protein